MSDTVRLYYLGGAPEREHANGARYVYVTSRNTPFIFPVERGWIDIRAYFARDLMRRYNTPDREVFSVNSALKSQISAQAAPAELSRDQLVAMLAEMDEKEKPSSRRTKKSEEEGGE